MFRLKGHAQCRFSHSICIGGLIHTKQWATTISPFSPQEATPGRNLVIFMFGGCPFRSLFFNGRVECTGVPRWSYRFDKKKKKNSTRWGGWNVLSNVCPPPVPYSNLRCREAPCVMRSPMPRSFFLFASTSPPPLTCNLHSPMACPFLVDLYVPRKWA